MASIMRAIFLVSVCLSAVTILAVARGWTMDIDRRLLDLLRRRTIVRADARPTRFASATRDLTALGGDTLRTLFVLACLFGLAADHRAADGVALVAISIVARIALFVLKRIVRRPRPAVAAPGVATYTSSFPSGHTFMAVVVYLSAALLVPMDAPAAVVATGVAFALALGLAIGATRMALGIHWPSDVLAGWALGVAWVTGCILIVRAAV
jgi:undecaprenyl-diphosphatase